MHTNGVTSRCHENKRKEDCLPTHIRNKHTPKNDRKKQLKHDLKLYCEKLVMVKTAEAKYQNEE